ncbi:hypothetical protein FQN54_005858 [Arachnomyces sp. PD_36]|nr:hypothetical protein FQN54_005858 [Arachnomyces sp. PD_36]
MVEGEQSHTLQQPSQGASSASSSTSHPLICTIGHGTRTLSELIQLLQSAQVTNLVDVRSIPRSFTNPQFNHDTLQQSGELRSAHIHYTWFGSSLGGRRSAKQPHLERHSTIRVAAFRNYAGYMATTSFKEGLADLTRLAETLKSSSKGHVAIMCSETLWWRCHRRMIADALATEGWRVQHLGVGKQAIEHKRWEIARRDDEGNLVYDCNERIT